MPDWLALVLAVSAGACCAYLLYVIRFPERF